MPDSLDSTDRGHVIVGRDGRVIQRKEASAKCRRCDAAFKFLMTTRPHKYCEPCRAIIAEELRVGRKNRQLARRKERRAAGHAEVKRRRPLIRYAGYDESERH